MISEVLKDRAPSRKTLNIKRILFAGVAVAVLDGLYFSISALAKGGSPMGVLNSIAGFWPASVSKSAVLPSASIGLGTHVGLAILMAAGFAALRPYARVLQTAPLIAGSTYGAALYVIMYLFVLPARWPTLFPAWDGVSSALDIAVHLAVGILIATIIPSTHDANHRAPLTV